MIVKDLWRSLIFCCIAQSLLAGHARAEADELLSMIAALRSEFRPVTVDDIEAAKLEVRNTLFEINGWLGYGQHARAWHDYLIWDEQIEGFQSRDVVDADVWQRVYYRVARDTDLLDADVFQKYRAALRTLISLIKAHNNPNLEADYQLALTEAEDLLSRTSAGVPLTNAARLADVLKKLSRQRQAPELIAAIRQQAIQPNLVIEVPAKLFASRQRTKEDYTFQQFINGSRVNGSGTLDVEQLFSLDAGEHEVVIGSRLSGTSISKSRGFGNGVTVQSVGSLNFASDSKIVINLEGVSTRGFDTTGTLSTKILGIFTNYTGRAASTARQTVYNRQEADRRAAQRQALADLDSTFNTRLDKLIAPLQASYRRDVYLPLLRHDGLPSKSNCTSDPDRAQMQFWFADEAQLAAPTSPPSSEDADERIRFAIHESAINNASALLEGRVRSLVGILNGKFFEYIAETAKPSERIDIRFHDEVAIRATLSGGTIEIRLVGAEYIIEGSVYPGMEITFRYHLEDDTSTILRLSEPPLVAVRVPAGSEHPRLGVRGIAMRRILSNLLKEHTRDAVDFAEVMLPEPFDQLGQLHIQRIVIDKGWFLVEAVPASEGEQGDSAARD